MLHGVVWHCKVCCVCDSMVLCDLAVHGVALYVCAMYCTGLHCVDWCWLVLGCMTFVHGMVPCAAPQCVLRVRFSAVCVASCMRLCCIALCCIWGMCVAFVIACGVALPCVLDLACVCVLLLVLIVVSVV